MCFCVLLQSAPLGLIVGLSVGGALILVIVVVIVACFAMKKSNKPKREVNANDNPTYMVDVNEYIKEDQPEYGNISRSGPVPT